MLFSVFYLSLFLSVGLLLARRAVPDRSAAVIVPLGCGFGVSLLAVLPALFAVVLGFTLPAVALAATAAAGIGAALLYRGTRLRGMAKDPDSGALWACLLPVVLITLYLLHTHVLHLVDGAYHTGQSLNRHLIFSDPAGESPQGAFKLRRLEPACTAIHNPVAARRKKADFQLLRRSANRKLCLITVAIRFPRCENRPGRNRKMPNARERVRHRFLLQSAPTGGNSA